MDIMDGLPLACLEPKDLFRNENELCLRLREDQLFWNSIGCCHNPDYRRHVSPDFQAKILGGNPKKPDYLGVEVEMWPGNFILHGHSNLTSHLIVSLKATSYRRMLDGVDVISLYRKMEDGWYHWSLDDDIRVLFRNRPSRLFPGLNAPKTPATPPDGSSRRRSHRITPDWRGQSA